MIKVYVREFRPEDISNARAIHDRYYPNNDFPDFNDNFNCGLTITDSDGNIICIAGIRQISELIAITDKSFSPEDRKTALQTVLCAVQYAQEKFQIKELVVFAHDDTKWIKRLIRSGFALTDNKVLTLSLRG